MRHVEGDIFSKIKAGRFLHEQLIPAIKQMLAELLDEAYLNGIREYGLEVAEASETFENLDGNTSRLESCGLVLFILLGALNHGPGRNS